MKTGIFKLILSVGFAVPFIFMFDGIWSVIAFAVAFLCNIIAVNLLIWIFVIITALCASINPKNKRLSRFYGTVLNFALTEICSLARIKVKTSGTENIPDVPYLLVANHRSNFDNFIISAVLNDPFLVFISKPSNFKIPFVGRIIKRCGYLAIDRENPRNALKTIHASAELVKNDGASVGVFPEGTRGHGESMAEFSEGCFLVAKKAACPIVVICLRGTDKVKNRFPFRTTVYLDVVGVITADEVKEKRSGELSGDAYAQICGRYLSVDQLPSKTI